MREYPELSTSSQPACDGDFSSTSFAVCFRSGRLRLGVSSHSEQHPLVPDQGVYINLTAHVAKFLR